LKRSHVSIVGVLFVVLALSLNLGFPVKGDGCGPVPPVAEFTYLPAYPYTNEATLFDGSASRDPDGFISNYTWSFDDGNSTLTLDSKVAHFYTSPGEYNVTLLVVDEQGLTNSTTRTVVVRTRVSASFIYSPVEPFVGQPISFDASNSTVSDGVIASYAWDFGDGNETVVVGPFVEHSYSEAGAYNVTLNVTSSSGFWAVAWEVVNVTAPPVHAPEAAFTWLPAIPRLGESVGFDASGSAPGSGNITSYAWDFGDGATQSDAESTVVHRYESFGDYVVSLNVTNSDGLSDVVNHSITVIAEPVADFFFSPSQPRVCGVVTFDASISDPRGGSIVSFQWIFDDNLTVQFGAVVTHRFRKMGEHVVSLNVTDSEGLWDVKNVTVTVRPHIADLNEDGVVNILDLFVFARAFGSSPRDERWDPRADISGDGVVNILDGVAIGRSFNMCADPIDP
jgi:PKD repeat protein